jgi:hypothetical protein
MGAREAPWRAKAHARDASLPMQACAGAQTPVGVFVAATFVGQALLGAATAPLGAPTPDAFADGLLLSLAPNLSVRARAPWCGRIRVG